MGKNIVVLCDGTNNVWKPGPTKTNVVRLAECLMVDRPQAQLVYYDPGVGTAEGYLSEATGIGIRDRLRRVAGLAWADGVWSNVGEAYRFLMNCYVPGDRIFLFGFSRGAFAARAVSGLINLCGLLRPWHDNMLPSLLEVYRSGTENKKQRESRNAAGAELRKHFGGYGDGPPIHFIGVWDTVESVGISQLLFNAQITSDPHIKEPFMHVRHAVALDELRWPYSPRLYKPREHKRIGAATPGRSYKQVWFCGAHRDVGGGEEDDGLSNIALHWMAREACALGLLADLQLLKRYETDPFGLQHDESAAIPLWSIVWTYKREYEARGMLVHESVCQRMMRPGSRYRPPLPGKVKFVQTLHEHTRPDGRREEFPDVPTKTNPGLPRKVGVAPWHFAWLAVSGLVTLLVGREFDAEDLHLAWLQLTHGWLGQLGSALAKWDPDGALVTTAIEHDLLFIAAYASLIPIAVFLALRFASPGGYPDGWLARPLGWAGGWLPGFDVAENLFTLWATGWPGSTCSTWTCKALGFVASFATSVASGTKLALLIGFLGALATAIGIGILRRTVYRARPDV